MKKKMGFLRIFSLLAVIAFVGLFTVQSIGPMFGLQVDFCAFIPFLNQHSDIVGIATAMAVIAPFPVDQKLTSVSVMYKNGRFVADRVLPYSPVKQSFKYRKFAKGTFLTIPETLVGRTGAPNRVELGFTEESGLTTDYALDDPIPLADIENAPEGYDPEAAAVEFITELLMLDREKRVADLVFDTDNYAAGNKATLSGTDQFSHASSHPINTIKDAQESGIIPFNKCVMGRAVASKLFKHADIVKAVHGNSGDTGIVSAAQFAAVFEFDEVIVGEGWYNSAKPGQTPSLLRVWGKSMLLFSSSPTASMRNGITFGLTGRFGNRIAGRIEDSDAGMRGGVRVRAGESVKELILANDLGYLLDAAVA
jgi:hypothetical protein